jgi:hypothetical protein
MRTGDARLLGEAGQYQREAVQAEEPGSPLWLMLASNLGNSSSFGMRQPATARR